MTEKKYRVIFSGCQHSAILTDKQLANPPIEEYDGSSTYKESFYFCEDCYNNKPGFCTIRPFHKVAVVRKLTPLEERSLLFQ